MTESTYPTPAEVRDGILRRQVFGFQRIGLTANVLEGSERYIVSDAVASRISVAIANGQLARSAMSPIDSTGQDLIDLAGVFGITERPASKATGYVTVTITGSATIPIAFRCTAPSGKKYETTATTIGAVTGTKVQVRAVEGGAATDQDPATVLTWDSAAIGSLRQTCVVDAGGLDGGADADTEEVLRQRLLDRLSFPLGGGNDPQVKAWAEESTAAVEKAYVYPGIRGAGSYDVAVTAVGGDRTLTSANVSTVAGYVGSKMPGGTIDGNFTSVGDQEVDVVLYLSLPLPQSAGGAGGGWRDGVPWPSGTIAVGTNDGLVTSYVAGTGVATVRTTTAPLVGAQIAVWDYTQGSETMNEYTVVTSGGVSGAYTITVADTSGTVGFKASPDDCYISPGAVNIATYADEFLAQMLLLGPGEKTANVDILPRGRRFPGTDIGNPAALTSKLLSPIDAAHEEIADISYAARLLTGTTTTQTTPSVPATTADPPRIFVLKHLGFRQAP